MSFLSRTNGALRTVAARPSPRLFSTAVVYRKSATESVKDGLKTVDRTVADAAVKGIDAGGKLKNSPPPSSTLFKSDRSLTVHHVVPNLRDCTDI